MKETKHFSCLLCNLRSIPCPPHLYISPPPSDPSSPTLPRISNLFSSAVLAAAGHNVGGVGVQERSGPPRRERRRRAGCRGPPQGPGPRPHQRGDHLLRRPRGEAGGAGVGAVPQHAGSDPVPQALLRAPHLGTDGLLQVPVGAHVRHRCQEPQHLRGP